MLTFDEKNHIYKYDGVVKPSVSEIINKVLKNDVKIPAYAMKAVLKGKLIHKIIQLHNEGKLDKSDLDNMLADYHESSDDPVLPYYESFLKWWEHSTFKSIFNEILFYEPQLDYCGTIDVIGASEILNKIVLIDYKTGGMYDTYPWQITGYMYWANSKAGYEILGRHIDTCGCLQLFKDGKIAKYHEYAYDELVMGWESICTVFRIKEKTYDC